MSDLRHSLLKNRAYTKIRPSDLPLQDAVLLEKKKTCLFRLNAAEGFLHLSS